MAIFDEIHEFRISIHAPPRGATMPVSRLPSGSLFQFTPLREGRPMSSVINCSIYVISIHAPPRGATARMNTALLRRNISIHAPPRGATIGQRICLLQEAFQFTPLREGRPLGSFASILQRYFNSRPSARGDGRACTVGYTNGDFNSRPSARGDQQGFCGALACCDYFNSRPSARGDAQWMEQKQRQEVISIHAPPRGATMSCDKSRRVMTYFNSRPSARGDDFKNQFGDMDFISIHAPPRGATSVVKFAEALGVFQFTPLREGRHADGKQESQATYFNSRPSARGDPWLSISRSCEDISIHAPPRGATCDVVKLLLSTLFQFTPLREGRQLLRNKYSQS